MKQILFYISLVVAFATNLSSQIKLDAQIEGGSTDTIFAGSPILIRVQLQNSFDEYAHIHNMEIDRNIKSLENDLSLEVIEQLECENEINRLRGLKKEMNPILVNPKKMISELQIIINNKALLKSQWKNCYENLSIPETTLLDGRNRFTWFLGITASTTKQWNVGDHTLKIYLDTLVTSAKEFYLDKRIVQENDLYYRLDIAYFSLDCGDINLAKEAALEIRSDFPESIDAIVLLADTELVLENYILALNNYKTALDLFYKQFPDSYEAPDYLLEQIEYIKENYVK